MRHASFKDAAIELRVTQAAVSQRVKELEDYLGLQLILRERPRIRPTAGAGVIAAAVRTGIDGIEAAVRSVRGRPDPGRIAIAATTPFSSYWLMPRLTGFFAAHPDLQVMLLTKDDDARDAVTDFDIGIVFSDRPTPGFVTTPLFADEVMAVCSPAFLRDRGPVSETRDLLGLPMLHLESEVPWMSWVDWFGALGIDIAGPLPGPRYTSYVIAVQAGLDGQGVMLGWRRLVQPLLQRGDLVQAAPGQVTPADRYEIVVPERLTDDEAVRLVRDWLLEEARADW